MSVPSGCSHCATSTTNGVIYFQLWSFQDFVKMYLIVFSSLDQCKEGLLSDYWTVVVTWCKKVLKSSTPCIFGQFFRIQKQPFPTYMWARIKNSTDLKRSQREEEFERYRFSIFIIYKKLRWLTDPKSLPKFKSFEIGAQCLK